MTSSAPALNVGNRFAHIDGMRAFAVMLVVVAHAGLGHIVPGGSGVTIFFTVSGFIITYLLLRERDKAGAFNIGGFYFRRAAKIFPPFALIIITPTLIWALFEPVGWRNVAAQIFFVFNWVYMEFGAQDVLPGSGVVWSLAIEEQFYIVFAIVWLLLVRTSWWRTGVTALAIAAIITSTTTRLALAGYPDAAHRIYYGTDTRMDGIAIGVLAALLLHDWTRRGEPSSWYTRVIGHDLAFVTAVAIYLLSLVVRDEWFRDTFRFTLQSLAAAVVILYGMFPSRGPVKRAFYAVSTWKPVAIVGLASYSIYLVHLIADNLLRGYIMGWPELLRVMTLVVIGVAAGVAIYYAVEVPVLRWRNRQKDSKKPASEVERAGPDAGT